MTEVIYLSERNTIPPKTEGFSHLKQRYTCTFDPNAPIGEQWVWQVDFTRTFKYYGSCETLSSAQVQARRKINKLLGKQHAEEERS